ncbi:MAG: CoA transferase [Actinomycetota bacterium]|jgi:benzylsuccinate CoA-transferase BbsF subunit|nr:CoA transferase [Actinomycetota bacterium]
MSSTALGHLRICDFTGQLAGAGATRHLGALGAEVIRIEDPVRQGKWDILRGTPPFKDERRGIEFGSAFQNHNVAKLGITIDMRTERGKELFAALVQVSDVVTENFAAGVLPRMGFGYGDLKALKDDIIYVSNCGFGHTGPYAEFKSWGPIAQAVGGLTFTSGLADMAPAGWGYSYMDHHGGYFMAIGILAALCHRNDTGEGQWVDMSCSEAGASLLGPTVLDYTVNGRPARREGSPNSNRDAGGTMAPHGIYATRGDDNWIAISVRDDAEWGRLVELIGEGWAANEELATVAGRLDLEYVLDAEVDRWTREHDRQELAARLQALGIPAVSVARPGERIDEDPATEDWGLWPTVDHAAMGEVRVDGLPVHFSETDWEIHKAAPTLGADNEYVFGEILGLSDAEIGRLRDEGVI